MLTPPSHAPAPKTPNELPHCQSFDLENIPTSWYVLSVNSGTTLHPSTAETRQKLRDVALSLIRKNSYASTSVDEPSAHAGVTNGACFHHLESKDAQAVAAANYRFETSATLFETAPYNDPLARVLRYLKFRTTLLEGEIAEFARRLGTIVQATYDTTPDIREACEAGISGHAATIAADSAEAMKRYGIRALWAAESLALHTQALLRGAFILAKGAAARRSRPPPSISRAAASSCCSNPQNARVKETL
jgi:TetR/AcrR family transcriptional repressor of nem operon